MVAAFAGVYGRVPEQTDEDFREFCWHNPWGATETDGQLGYALRLYAAFKLHWHEAIASLRRFGQ